MFRARKERLKAGYLAAEAAGRVAEVAVLFGEPIPRHESGGEPARFKVLRPARVGDREVRIVFAMERSETAVLLCGTDSEQEEQAWLSEAVPEVLRRYRSHMDDRPTA